MAADSASGGACSGKNNFYYRESKLITSNSDSDSDDYQVPPELESDSEDSDCDSNSDQQRASSHSISVPNTKSFVDDSLPHNSFPPELLRPHAPARKTKSDSDGNLKAHLVSDDKDKQTAIVQPIQQPHIPKHAQARQVDGRVNLGKIL